MNPTSDPLPIRKFLEQSWGQVLEIQQRSQSDGAQHKEVLDLALQELHRNLEELEAADAEMTEQTNEILSSRARLEAERQRQQALFELAPDAYLVTNAHGVIADANQAAAALFNVPPQFLAGKPLVIFVPLEERETFRTRLNQLPTGKSTTSWEIRLAPHDRVRVDVAISTSLDRDPVTNQRVIYWLLRDVTAERQAEAEIRSLNLDLERRVAERTAALQIESERVGRLLGEERRARARAEAAEARFALLASTGELLAMALDLDTVLRTATRLTPPDLARWTLIYLVDRATLALGDRQSRAVTVGGADLPGGSLTGELERVFNATSETEAPPPAIARAISQRRPAVVDLQAAPDELAQTAEQQAVVAQTGARWAVACPLLAHRESIGAIVYLGAGRPPLDPEELSLTQALTLRVALAVERARLYNQAQEAVHVRDRFLLGVSHDLRHPLTVIGGYAELGQTMLRRSETVSSDQVARIFENIGRGVTRMAQQINDLLEVMQYRADRPLPLKPETLDLVEVIATAVDGFRRNNPRREIRLTLPSVPLVGSFDPSRLERVLANLLTNALKFSPPQTAVEVSLAPPEAEGAWALLRVADHGIGIPESDLPRLFEYFHRGRNVAESVAGTGVGLASARQIVEQHGGTISVESQEGVGTIFSVKLPVGS
jgi:PAS domain S-box-containing protein